MPTALHDKYWIVRGGWNSSAQVSQLGTTARIILPNELVLGADAGLVASYPVIKDDLGHADPVVGPDGVTINVRAVGTGAILRTFVSTVTPTFGLMAGKRLFWWGAAISVDSPDPAAVVWAIDLGDSSDVPRRVIAAGDLPKGYAPDWGRSLLWLSDRGRAVMSTVVGETGKATQVIDVGSMAIRMTIEDEIAYEVLDGTVLIRRDDGVALLDLATGTRIGSPLRTDQVLRTFAGDNAIYLQHGRFGGGLDLTSVDNSSGSLLSLLHQSSDVVTLSLEPELSVPGLLVLLDENALDEGALEVPVSLLDPLTGALQRDAFSLDLLT